MVRVHEFSHAKSVFVSSNETSLKPCNSEGVLLRSRFSGLFREHDSERSESVRNEGLLEQITSTGSSNVYLGS
jgi:hypothetical protein